MRAIAVIGSGTIGQGWAVAFARAGRAVRLYDAAPGRARAAADAACAIVADLPARPGCAAGEITACDSLATALEGVEYVQECVPERLDAKRAVHAELGRATGPDVVLGSSASTLLPDDFLDGEARERSLIAHPFNPTYLLPVVELVPSRWTRELTVARAREVLESAGQRAVLLRKPVFGYIGNRLQAAVINEAMALIAAGVTTPDELDAVMTHGLGPRWSLSGPFETMDLNAAGGVADYAAKYGEAYAALGRALSTAVPWDAAALEQVVRARRAALPAESLAARGRARDRALAVLNEALAASGFGNRAR